MAVSKTEILALSLQLATIENMGARVAAFNAVAPWVKRACPKYSLVDFYEDTFKSFNRWEKQVKWNGVTQRAMLASSIGEGK